MRIKNETGTGPHIARRGPRRGIRRLLRRGDHDGQQLAYVYFEDEPGRRSAAKLLTKNEARRVAEIIAKLPELVGPA